MAALADLPVLPEAVDALAWHKHEMLFGFAAAAMAGFILTAIPNWTGGPPIAGARLGVLVALWAVGRIAFLAEGALGQWAVAGFELAFLFALVASVARELIAGGNARNFPVLGLIALFAAGDVLVHLERLGIADTADAGFRLSIFILAMLLALIGGRVIPSFTGNWLSEKGMGPPPAAAKGPVDRVALVGLAVLVIAEVAAPQSRATAALALAVGLLHAWRLVRWRGFKAITEPLLWVLHLGYGWLAAGLVLVGIAGLVESVAESAALHALTTGAFGTMILGVATRAALGHTGRPLTAGAGTTIIFVAITVAAVARIAAPLLGEAAGAALLVSGFAWILGFGLFAVLYFPVLTTPRVG